MVRVSSIDDLDVLAHMASAALGRVDLGMAVLCFGRYFAVAGKNGVAAPQGVAADAFVAYLATAKKWEALSVEGGLNDYSANAAAARNDYSANAAAARDAAYNIAAASRISGDFLERLEEKAAGMASIGRVVQSHTPAAQSAVGTDNYNLLAELAWRRSQVLGMADGMPYCRW